MSLKQKTISGFSWAFIERGASMIVQFIFGIILARLLSPKEYGLLGMLAIFLAIADTLVIGGYGEALIRKTKPTQADYSTVFFCNLGTALLCYAALFLSAPFISSFFNEPVLTRIIKVLGLIIIINSLALVPRVHLWRSLDVKSLTKVSVFANGVAGVFAISLAFMGYGVWSLVWKRIIESFAGTLFVYYIAKPRFEISFSYQSFREIFGFGSKLIASRLLNEIYTNTYYFVIGKYFSARELGLYTKAVGYKDLFSRTLTNIIKSVSFPALSEIKEDSERLKMAYKKIIKATMYLTFILMFSLAASADNFIIGLIGPKWKEAALFLQLLCFAGIFYPLTYLNLNMLIIKGRSDLNLIIEVVRKVIAIPVIVIGVLYGIRTMIIALVVSSAIDYFLSSIWSGKQIGYSLKEQMIDIFPSFLLAAILGGIVYLTGMVVPFTPLLSLLIQSVTGMLFIVIYSEQFKISPYLQIKEIIASKTGFSFSF